MKREKDSTETGFLAKLRRSVLGAIAPTEPQTETPASELLESDGATGEEQLADEAAMNSVGKKIFELKVRDAKAVRPQLPTGFFYPDAQDAADLHAELLRELPPNHPLAGVPLETFAAREGNDDTLFRYRGNPRRFVLVRLTGVGRAEINEHFPELVWSGTFEEFGSYLVEPPT